MPCARTTDGDDRTVAAGDTPGLVDGKDLAIYAKDAIHDLEFCTFVGAQQMGRWLVAEVRFSPFDCNPVSAAVRVVEEATVVLSYKRGKALPAKLVSRAPWDVNAAAMLENADDPALGYPTAKDGARGPGEYVIITTAAIQADSTQLAAFVAHKQAWGFTVAVKTEADWGGGTGDAAGAPLHLGATPPSSHPAGTLAGPRLATGWGAVYSHRLLRAASANRIGRDRQEAAMSVAEGVGVDIERAETAGDYRLRLAFSDGHSVTGDFESFLRHSRNPGVRDYLEAGRFAQFALVDGNLVWGDYEMVFPIDDLYAGDLLHGRGETEAALAVAEVPAAYGRTTRRSGGHARKSRRE